MRETITISYTLSKIPPDQTPEIACVTCPNALWHGIADKQIRVFCKLMHSLIDEPITICDGNAPKDEAI